MVNRSFFLFLILICTSVLQARFCSAQDDDSTSRVGIGIKMSLLGAGVEVATPITGHSNLRAGFNAFSYDRTFHSDGIAYAGQLRFRSVEAHYDWFPFGGAFHVSPGVLAYNGNQFTANASVPGVASSYSSIQRMSNLCVRPCGRFSGDDTKTIPPISSARKSSGMAS